MPAVNFKPRFAPKVRSRSKRTTIRPRGKSGKCRFKVGDKFFGYSGMRTDRCVKLIESVVVKVTPLNIRMTMTGVFTAQLDGTYIGMEEANSIAEQDGFTRENEDRFFSYRQFLKFFMETYDLSVEKPFIGDLIEWK